MTTANREAKKYSYNHWDTYDVSNDHDAVQFLESVTDTSIWEELKGREDSSFCVLFIELCTLLQPKNKDYFDGITKKLEALKVSAYPGEHVPSYTSQALVYYRDLKHSGYICMDHFKYLLQALANANGSHLTVENAPWKQTFLDHLAVFRDDESEGQVPRQHHRQVGATGEGSH